MSEVLVLQHVPWERPGLIGEALDAAGVPWSVRTVVTQPDPELPAARSLAGLVVMGGPMNADDDAHFPGLAAERALIADAVAAGVPVLGVCLGAQLLARACGGAVTPGAVREIGFGPVRAVVRDAVGEPAPDPELGPALDPVLDPVLGPVLARLGTAPTVLHWHCDAIVAPPGSRNLAESAVTPVQAFRLGSAVGLQFHIEVDAALLEEWLRTPAMVSDLRPGEREEMLAAGARVLPGLTAAAREGLGAFARGAAERRVEAGPRTAAGPGQRRIAVLTGAGISTGGGIPDFRGPQGVWTRDPGQAELLDIHRYMASADVRRRCWQMWRDHPAWGARPTPAHRALVELERAGALLGVLTQNFDGLHQAAGQSPALVTELHGSLAGTSCLRCGQRWETREVVGALGTGGEGGVSGKGGVSGEGGVVAADGDPRHEGCGGVLKPDIVYFGELLPDGALERAAQVAQDADVFLAIGTTLQVQPVASLAALAARSGAELVIVNNEPTPYDRMAARVLREPIDVAVPELVRALVE